MILGSASITLNKLPTTTAASFDYSASGFVKPADVPDHRISYHGDSKNGQEIREERKYSSLSYSWSFHGGKTSSSQSGTTSISGLNPGAQGWFGGTVTVTYYETIITTTITWTTPKVEETYTEDVTTTGEDGKPVTTKVEKTRLVDGETEREVDTDTQTVSHTETASDGLNYWTKPNSFSFNINQGDVITLTLYASDVVDFGKHVGKYQRWQHQSGSYSDKTYNVSSGDLITASIYNQIADDVGVEHVSGGSDGTIISASLWDRLAEAVS